MTEPSTPEDKSGQLISEYAEAIGMLTIYWASLENTLTHVILTLLQSDEMTASCIGASVDKAAGRAMLIQRLVLRPNESPADEWRDCMLGLCDQITNNLGPKRNRLVHDDWNISETAIERHNTGLRIGKPSERAAKALLTYDKAPSHAPQIWKLTRQVIDVAFYITAVGLRYSTWKRSGKFAPLHERAILVSKGIAPARRQPDLEVPTPPPES
jgi:hypothetical protein